MPSTSHKPIRIKCRDCSSPRIAVETGQQRRRVEGKQRAVVNVRCLDCGHSWWSRSRFALTEAKRLDAAAEAR